jgi:mRNA interferase RelE/StbE
MTPAYQVFIKRSAEKDLDSLSAGIRKRIVEHILALEEQPRPGGSRKLKGREGYRLHVGNYRVLYSIDDQKRIVMIYAVGHRREVYR